MKILRLFALLIVVLLSVSVTQAQQSVTIQVSPTSGAPGSTVTITEVGSSVQVFCTAHLPSGPVRIGTLPNPINYTIPGDIRAGNTITFECSRPSPRINSNSVSFQVTSPPAPPPDSDGDGIPDNADACPNQAGPAGGNGCPAAPPANPQPNPPAQGDSDGDGIIDSSDACPTVAGPVANNGCPAGPSPTPFSLPALPTSGQCMVATQGATPVNVREGTSTDTAIVGQLDPSQTYPVIGQNADGSWLQMAQGWVAGYVTRHGGDCASLPQTDGTGGSTAPAADGQPDQPIILGSVPNLPHVAGVDALVAHFAGCPDVAAQVGRLPNFLVLDLGSAPDPCAAAADQVDSLFFNAAQASSPSSQWNDSLLACNQHGWLDFFPQMLDYLAANAPATYQALDAVLTPDNICDYAHEMWNHHLPALTPDGHAVAVAAARCEQYVGDLTAITSSWFTRTVHSLKSLGMTETSMSDLTVKDNGQASCDLVHAVTPVGQASPANGALFHMLVETCNLTIGHAGLVAFDKAIRLAGDAAAAADQGCYAETALESLKLPPDQQPIMPSVAQGADCKGSFRMLATHNDVLSAPDLFRLLKSADPCTNAELFATSGHAALPNLPLPDCIVGASIHLTGTPTQPTVDVGPTSSWHDKIVLLDRPISQICDYLDPSSSTGSLVINPTDTPPAFAAAPPSVVQQATTEVPPQLAAVASLTPIPPPVQQEAQPAGGSPTPEQPSAQLETVAQPDWTLPLLRQVLQIDTAGASGMVLATDNAGQLQAYSLGLSDQPQPIPLPDDMLGTPSLTPDGQFVSYLIGAGETVSLNFQPIKATADQQMIDVPIALPPTFVDNSQPLVWFPDAPKVLVPLAVGSNSTIYVVDLRSGDGQLTPLPLIENGASPDIAPNGRLIAFERDGNIWVMSVSSGEMQAVTDQPDGSPCFGAQFGMDSLSLFFTCQTGEQRSIFRYGLNGVKELDFGVPNAGDPAPGPTTGMIAFNDGSTIYIARDDGSDAQLYAYLNGAAHARMVWSRENAATAWLLPALNDRSYGR